MKRWRRTLASVALACAALATACGGDSGPSAPDYPKTPIGSYTIGTVNGKAPPVTVYADGTYTYELTNGTLALKSDATYLSVLTYRQTLPGSTETIVDSTNGTWVQNGSAIHLTDALDATSTIDAVWAKGQLTFASTDGKATTTYIYNQAR